MSRKFWRINCGERARARDLLLQYEPLHHKPLMMRPLVTGHASSPAWHSLACPSVALSEGAGHFDTAAFSKAAMSIFVMPIIAFMTRSALALSGSPSN